MLKVLRTDILQHEMNENKKNKVLDVLRLYRKEVVIQASRQWGYFFKTGIGIFNKYQIANTIGLPTAYQQIARDHAISQLNSFISNRQNDFKKYVSKSSLNDLQRYELFTINSLGRWFYRPTEDEITAGYIQLGKLNIPLSALKLARNIMRHALSLHNKPDLSKANILADQRTVRISRSNKSTEFNLWLDLTSLEKRKLISIPLIDYSYFNNRSGDLSNTVQVIEKNGEITFGLMHNMASTYALTKSEYIPETDFIAPDFGLRTLLATDQGHLFGRRFIDKLKILDKKIQKIQKYLDKKHIDRNKSITYKKLVIKLRGFIKTEINRILNHIVDTIKPRAIVLENNDFRNVNLSHQMNRLLSNCGISYLNKKLASLHEEFGIEIIEVNKAYTSQECNSCGYVDKKNRNEEEFECEHCLHSAHADVSGATNVGERRSLTSDNEIGNIYTPRRNILIELVNEFNSRNPYLKRRSTSFKSKTGQVDASDKLYLLRELSDDPRLSNPYFKEWINILVSGPERYQEQLRYLKKEAACSLDAR
jgi:putative transposase